MQHRADQAGKTLKKQRESGQSSKIQHPVQTQQLNYLATVLALLMGREDIQRTDQNSVTATMS